MWITKRKPRVPTLVGAALIMLLAAVGLPLVPWSITEDFVFEPSTLVASPGNTFQITNPVVLATVPLVVIERGMLVLVEANGKPVQGATARDVLANGGGSLLLSGGNIRIGAAGSQAGAPAGPQGGAQAGDQLRDAHQDPLLGALATRSFRTLHLAGTSLLLRLPDRSELAAKATRAKLDFSRKDQVTASGTVSIKGVPVAIDMSVGPAARTSGSESNALSLSFKSKSDLLNVRFDGRLSAAHFLEMRGNGRVRSDNLRGAITWLAGAGGQGAGLKKFEIAGEVEWSQQGIAFDKAQVQLDDNTATGALALGVAAGRPSITGTLALTKLDLSRYIIGDLPQQTLRGFDLAALSLLPFYAPISKQIDADVRLSASRVVAAGLELGESAATVALKQGQMMADIAQFSFAGGQGAGQLAADFRGYWPSFSFRGKLAGIDPARSSFPSAVTRFLHGDTSIAIDVTGQGSSLAEVARSVNGRLSVSALKGGRLGLDLRGLLASPNRQPVHGWSGVGTMAYDTLNAEFHAQSGVFATKQLEAVAGGAVFTGVGTISLASGEIDMFVEQRETAAAGQGASANGATRLIIRGAAAAPVIRSTTLRPEDDAWTVPEAESLLPDDARQGEGAGRG